MQNPGLSVVVERIKEAAAGIPASAEIKVHKLDAFGVLVPGVPGSGADILRISAPVFADGDFQTDCERNGVETGKRSNVLEEEIVGESEQGAAGTGVSILRLMHAFCTLLRRSEHTCTRTQNPAIEQSEEENDGRQKRYKRFGQNQLSFVLKLLDYSTT